MAFIITALYNLFMPKTVYHADLHLKVGQIVEKDIIAPYDFPILKSPKQLEAEKAKEIAKLKPVYSVSEEINFNTIKSINDIFLPLAEQSFKADTVDINRTFVKHGINLSDKSKLLLHNPQFSKSFYNFLMQEITTVLTQGVYDTALEDTIIVSRDSRFVKTTQSSLLSKDEAIEKIILAGGNTKRQILSEMLPALIPGNLIKDPKKFEELASLATAEIPDTLGTIKKNEIIVRSNSRLSEEDYNKIQSLINSTRERETFVNPWKSLTITVSFFMYFLVLGLMFYYFMKVFYGSLLQQRFHFVPLLAGLALNSILALINNQILGLQTLLIPYSLAILSAAILIDVPFALFYNFLSFASIYPFVNWETFSPLIMMLATASVLLLMTKLYDKHQYFTIWVYQLITTACLTLIFTLYKIDTFAVVIANIGYAFISSTLSIMLMLFIVPYFEKKWNLATKRVLLELLDFNHPLLKKLAKEAVGTYYHSLVVGNLAERAAEAIGANPLLARVGSYYHDIGKISHPEFFTENNQNSSEIHDELTPAESAEHIRSHVEEGIMLAKKYHVPSVILDIILEHHGTGFIRYFLDKAEKSSLDFDLNQYIYNGPKPKSKEAVLVMIADIVESTTKSMTDTSTESIAKVINDTIHRLIKDGQLDDSSITLNDLSKVKEYMLPILESIYRKRQQYPEPLESQEL